MDVVKTNVEAIGGTVSVSSRLGAGTTVHIDIPLTLAIIPALLVSAGEQRYAIPEGSLVEILRIDPDPELGELGVEYISGTPIYRRRGELIPLANLEALLAGRSQREVAIPANVVVVSAEGRKLGIVVDDLHDSEEIVVKPLARQVHGIPLYAGATILGDGRVSLILDIRGLADEAGLVTRRAAASPAAVGAPAVGAPADAHGGLLVVKCADRRIAVPARAPRCGRSWPRGRGRRCGRCGCRAVRRGRGPRRGAQDPSRTLRGTAGRCS
jgi:two-component system chemotaxis sensor kinase CheA